MILIINKLDRLVFEKNYTIEEARNHLEKLVSSINTAVSLISDNNGQVFEDNYFDP